MIKTYGLYAIITLMIRQRERDESPPITPDYFLYFMLAILSTLVTLCAVLLAK